MKFPPVPVAAGVRHALLLGQAALLLLLVASGCRNSSGPAGVGAPPSPGAITTRPAASTNAAPAPPPKLEPGWQSLFDGRTLTGWSVTDFAGRGEVKVQDGNIRLESGIMTGVNWTNAAALPRLNYEVALDAMRVEGSDFFCALTFPVGEDPCSLIVGGWGGGVVGLSSLDGMDAANNDTTKYLNFENGRWIAIRVRVTGTNISAWIDGDRVVDADTKDRRLSIRPEVEDSRPLGIASWSTTAALRNIRLRRL